MDSKTALKRLASVYRWLKANQADPFKYKDIPIGSTWEFDDYQSGEHNPPLYYIPVGDGLYRPTKDVRVFLHEACKVIYPFKAEGIRIQLEALLQAGFHLYDIALAIHLRFKDLESYGDHYPPFVEQHWRSAFSENCEWHPSKHLEEKARELEAQRVFSNLRKDGKCKLRVSPQKVGKIDGLEKRVFIPKSKKYRGHVEFDPEKFTKYLRCAWQDGEMVTLKELEEQAKAFDYKLKEFHQFCQLSGQSFVSNHASDATKSRLNHIFGFDLFGL